MVLDIANNFKTIGIFTSSLYGAEPWDPDSINSGITGSEEAVIYMSQKLALLGYKVTVFGDPPLNSPHSLPTANPLFIPANFAEGAQFDIAIAWRMPEVAARLRKGSKCVYFWPHDICTERYTKEQIEGFDDVLWLSQWQRKQWISMNPAFVKFIKIFGNGINVEQFHTVEERANPHSLIYGSNYGRGLEILLDLWPAIKKQFPKATLDIYYGWQHWGLLSPVKEAKMRVQMANLISLDVHEHGLVGHAELNRAFEHASIWAYPCIDQEVFCITALKAQFAGAVPVIIEGSALQETVRHGFKCSTDYYGTLVKAMQAVEKIPVAERKKMGEFILQEYTWDIIARKWKQLFTPF